MLIPLYQLDIKRQRGILRARLLDNQNCLTGDEGQLRGGRTKGSEISHLCIMFFQAAAF